MSEFLDPAPFTDLVNASEEVSSPEYLAEHPLPVSPPADQSHVSSLNENGSEMPTLGLAPLKPPLQPLQYEPEVKNSPVDEHVIVPLARKRIKESLAFREEILRLGGI